MRRRPRAVQRAAGRLPAFCRSRERKDGERCLSQSQHSTILVPEVQDFPNLLVRETSSHFSPERGLYTLCTFRPFSRQKLINEWGLVPLAGLRWTPPSTPEHGPRSSGRVRAAAPRPRLIRASRRLNHRQEALRSAADCAGAQPRVLAGLGVGCGCSTRGSL